MKNVILAAALASAASVSAMASHAYAAAAPCEDKLVELRTAIAASKLDAAGMQKVKDLEAKGVERCNADDDTRADAFFAEAMTILGK